MTRSIHFSALDVLESDGYAKFGRVLSTHQAFEFRQQVCEAVSSGLLPHGVERQDDGESSEGTATFLALFGACEIFQPTLVRRLAREATDLLGGRSRLLSDEMFIKPALIGAPLSWHQDWPVYPEMSESYVTFWVALSDVNSSNGALQFVPGSHRRGRFLPGEFRNGLVPDPRLLALEDSMEILPEVSDEDAVDAETLEAGQASVHHCLTWHRSKPNPSSEERAAAVLRFVRAVN